MAVQKPSWREELKGKYVYPGRTKITGIILHDTAGMGGHGDTKYLANPGDGRQVCCDFTVERDGSIWKLNPDIDKFYTPHAGRATNFKGLKNKQVTKATVGIEICQHVKLSLVPTYPKEQVQSVAHLCAYLVAKYKLVTSDITTHRQIITDGTRSDPRLFPFEGPQGFWKLFWEYLSQGEEYECSESIPKIPEEGKETHNVEPGETLFAIATKYYGNGAFWERIKFANNLKNDVIIPGQVLEIPPGDFK